MDTHIDEVKAKEYYVFLKATFGGISFKGLTLLAELLTVYKQGEHLKHALAVVAKAHGLKADTVKLDLATYVRYINTQFTNTDISNMFGYAPKTDETSIKPAEFVLLLRDYLDTLEAV